MKKILVMALAVIMWIPAMVHSSEEQRTINVRVNVSGLYNAAATSVTLKSGQGLNLPDPATLGSYQASWWNSKTYTSMAQDPKGEIVLVTAKSGDVLTVTRGQGGTSASTKNTSGGVYVLYVGYITITKKDSDVGIVQTVPVTITGAVSASPGPVTVVNSVLPTGASTEATLALLNGKVTACDTTNVTVGSLPSVTVGSSVLPTGAATESTLSTLNGKVTACNTGAVVVSTSALPTGASTEATLSTLNGKVTACNTGAVVVSTSALPTGAATEATLSSLNGKAVTMNTGAVAVSTFPDNEPINVAQIGGVAAAMNAGTASTGTQRVVLATDQSPVTVRVNTSALPTGAATESTLSTVSSEVTSLDGKAVTINTVAVAVASLPANASVNQTQVNGVAVAVGSGASSTGTQRVILATDQSAVTTVVSTFPDNEPINVAQMNGTAVAMGAGNSSTGTQRVVLATDQSPVTVFQSGHSPGGGHTIETVYLNATASGTTTLVAADADEKIYVTGYSISNNGTSKIKAFLHYTGTMSTSNRVGGGTLAADGGGEARDMGGHVKTNMSINQALSVNLSGAGDVDVVVHYYVDP